MVRSLLKGVDILFESHLEDRYGIGVPLNVQMSYSSHTWRAGHMVPTVPVGDHPGSVAIRGGARPILAISVCGRGIVKPSGSLCDQGTEPLLGGSRSEDRAALSPGLGPRCLSTLQHLLCEPRARESRFTEKSRSGEERGLLR
ncbi:hypothetical protein TREES_T100014055 [Tupaia chinensis]|uniref:Uncharacterized protein n=1 Tax=Tupaia chinensis TaxID=246437 RepID=L9KQP7_TUPCH|nr:hypothetical protein TREES_T100014055 [Tupaia chinensis]